MKRISEIKRDIRNLQCDRIDILGSYKKVSKKIKNELQTKTMALVYLRTNPKETYVRYVYKSKLDRLKKLNKLYLNIYPNPEQRTRLSRKQFNEENNVSHLKQQISFLTYILNLKS